eukprot:CAMPEP_0118890206 /NCGR_PEP_ID=MMETSP1166-20130328/781_1 /TAXON_ID=1104430 /ORGANISM="Chrysoreinhardia sp, Strain CCMP3193" /LENGTH=129 /DNA_ID=CAMNT_0006828811 /DNA_START=425 /DNA_END=814 /DNA_ORIENTATION=-
MIARKHVAAPDAAAKTWFSFGTLSLRPVGFVGGICKGDERQEADDDAADDLIHRGAPLAALLTGATAPSRRIRSWQRSASRGFDDVAIVDNQVSGPVRRASCERDKRPADLRIKITTANLESVAAVCQT